MNYLQYPKLPTFSEDNFINYYETKITEFFFQLTRKPDDVMDTLAVMFDELLSTTLDMQNRGFDSATNYNIMLYKMIAHTRDIYHGKGERKLAYMMIYVWYKYNPEMALLALESFIDIRKIPSYDLYDESGGSGGSGGDFIRSYSTPLHSGYGCWKDIKYFCYYVYQHSPEKENDKLIFYALSIMSRQLLRDYKIIELYKNHSDIRIDYRNTLSYVAKWIPREKTKFGWLFETLAIQWAQFMTPYLVNGKKTDTQHERSLNKCKSNFRKVVSLINRLLDTNEIKQCSKSWAEIEPGHISHTSILKHKNAFLNINGSMEDRPKTKYDVDRRKCSQRFKEYYKDLSNPKSTQQHKTLWELGSFVKSSLELGDLGYSGHLGCSGHVDCSGDLETAQNILYKKNTLNQEWNGRLLKIFPTENFIPFVDILGNESLFHAAIELSMIISSKSSFTQRIMFANHSPVWMNLSEYSDFTSRVHSIVQRVNIDFNLLHTNILAAIDLFLISLQTANTCASDVDKMVFVIITNKSYQDVYKSILEKFENLGYNPPFLIFWNLGGNGFDSSIDSHNTKIACVSGMNGLLLNHFRFVGWNGMLGPFDTVSNLLSHPKYDFMEKIHSENM